MKLYELSATFADLFDQFDEINTYTPDKDADGNYIDDDGEIITDLEALRENYRQAWFDTLTAIEGEFDTKAENIAVYIKNMTAEVKALKAEEDALRLRRKAFEKSVERMKAYLLGSMHAVGKLKIDMPRARLNIRKNAESLVVENDAAFIEWAQAHNNSLLKYSLPEIRKTEAKKLVQAGKQLPFVHLARSESLQIK
ncbi:MAG: siphovirus Gp157 family protein [Ruminococcus sp.]|nr:siphovirus Gp157 family protein [Ruminococcus sp.]